MCSSDLSSRQNGLMRLLGNCCEARNRAYLLQSLRDHGKLVSIQSVVQRASRLADKGDLSETVLEIDQRVEPALFESQSEAELFALIQRLSPLARSSDTFAALAEELAGSSATLSSFFDGPDSVMVMCEDINLRNNRIALLSILRNQASILGDFTLLENE